LSQKIDLPCRFTKNSALQLGALLWRQIEEYAASSRRDGLI